MASLLRALVRSTRNALQALSFDKTSSALPLQVDFSDGIRVGMLLAWDLRFPNLTETSRLGQLM